MFSKIKGTMSKFDIEIEDDILRKIIIELKPIYKTYFLTNLPTIKEIDIELANRPLPTSNFDNGIAAGAKEIINELKKI